MRALTTTQGTAMAEYALCELHYRSEKWRNDTVEDAGIEASLDEPHDRWDGGGWVDVRSNDALECRVCGENEAADE